MGMNRPSLRTGHNAIAVVGTAEQCTAAAVPQGIRVVYRARSTNAGLIVRLQNSTDGTNGAGLSMTICYKD